MDRAGHSSAVVGCYHVGMDRLGLVGIEHLPLRDTGEENGRPYTFPTVGSYVFQEAPWFLSRADLSVL